MRVHIFKRSISLVLLVSHMLMSVGCHGNWSSSEKSTLAKPTTKEKHKKSQPILPNEVNTFPKNVSQSSEKDHPVVLSISESLSLKPLASSSKLEVTTKDRSLGILSEVNANENSILSITGDTLKTTPAQPLLDLSSNLLPSKEGHRVEVLSEVEALVRSSAVSTHG